MNFCPHPIGTHFLWQGFGTQSSREYQVGPLKLFEGSQIQRQAQIRNLRKKHEGRSGKHDVKRIDVVMKLPNRAELIKTDFMEDTLFIEIKEC